MADTIFFTEVDKTVQAALNLRKQHYAKASGKSTDTYSWIYKKRAWAQASVISKVTGKSAILAPRTGGGVGANGLYKKSTNTPKYLPKPHLNSVKISPIGDWGSVVKCDFTFTVYSLSQLNEMQPFFDLGSKCEIQYGWQFAGPAGGKNGKLNAVVYNFSQTLTDNGGFDCTVQTMAEGIAAVVGADIKGKSDITDDKITAALTNGSSTNLPALNLLTLLETIKKDKDNSSIVPGTIDEVKGLGVEKIPSNLLSALSSSDTTEDKEIPETQMYISLESLIKQINLIQYGADPNDKQDLKNKYVCDETITRGYVNELDKRFFMSANPAQISFPGFNDYGNGLNIGFGTGEYATKFAEGDLSKTMIGIDYLIELYKSIDNPKASQDRSKNTTITKFLGDVLTSIYDNSGTRFKLSIFQNPKDKTKVLITDQGYIGEDTTAITPYILTSIEQGGICRQMSLSTNLSPEMVSAAYSTSLSSLGSQETFTPGQTKTSESAPTETINKLRVNVFTSARSIAENAIESQEGASDIDTLISNLRTALKELYAFEVQDKSSGKSAKGLIYPLSLQMTLDGIDGIIFGNAITTNYLPLAYKASEIAFTITTVEHTIEDGDWTTNINTVMRILK